MAAQTPPYVQQNGSHTAALFRQAFASLFGATQPGTLASTAGGVVNTTDLAVTAQASPNMTVNVAGGSCWIPQTQAANGGLYFGLNDATVVVAIAASNATNPRVDLICATVNDAAYSGSTNNWTLQAITGTPTAGANLTNKNGAGALPAASIPLAYVLVPATSTQVVTGNIQDARTFMGMPNANRSNPSGRMYASSSTAVNNTVTLISTVQDYVRGGVTFSSNALTVATTGIYQINAQVSWGGGTSLGGFANIIVQRQPSGGSYSTVLQGTQYVSSFPAAPNVSSTLLLTAGDSLQIAASIGNSTAQNANTGSQYTFLAATLVSQ
jgi:hypothetical protein